MAKSKFMADLTSFPLYFGHNFPVAWWTPKSHPNELKKKLAINFDLAITFQLQIQSTSNFMSDLNS